MKQLENIEKVGFLKQINQTYLKHINESKFVIGLAMILLNVGSKYVDFKFTKSQEQLLRNGLAREILIFTIVFMGTRDILYAILLTSAFIILSEYVFNDKSKYCLVSNRMKKLMALVDTNKDDNVTPEEEQRALEILRRAERNREKNMQNKFSSYLNNMNSTLLNNE
jgi:hypothetical protein